MFKSIKMSAVALTITLVGLQPGWAQYGGESIEITPIVGVQSGGGANELVIRTEYKDGCYSPLRSLTHQRGVDRLVVVHLARVERENVCIQAINYHQFSISTAHLKKGSYTLVDGYDGEEIITFRKTESRTEISGTANPPTTPTPVPSPGIPGGFQ